MSDYELPVAGTTLTCAEARGAAWGHSLRAMNIPLFYRVAGMMNHQIFTHTLNYAWLQIYLPSQEMTVRQFYWRVWTVILHCSQFNNMIAALSSRRLYD